MTRINVVPPRALCNEHLLAEAREIKRVPNVINSGRYSLSGMPSTYVLGTGHVKFFYNKLGWLLKRYKALYSECLERGFNVTDFSDAWEGVPNELVGGWDCTSEAVFINRKRIEERLAEMKKIHYFNNKISSKEAKNILWLN